jgi:hypothetical protein
MIYMLSATITVDWEVVITPHTVKIDAITNGITLMIVVFSELITPKIPC